MIEEKATMKKKWTIRRYNTHQDFLDGKLPGTIIDGAGKMLPGESVFEGNVLLQEGIGELLELLVGNGATAYSNANAYLGVGESATVAAATQTGLIGSTTTHKGMETSYPSINATTVTFRSVFGSADANNVWQEFTVVNASSDTGQNLNRKVSDQGIKASGQTWTLDLAITFS